MTSADRIADCALDHYAHGMSTHQRGKPKPESEWTVYAAIVAERSGLEKGPNTDKKHLWVVSCATGTKCTARRVNGCVLHDCHAEVLAKRGLQRVLWLEILRHQRQSSLDTTDSSSNQKFLLEKSNRTDGTTTDEASFRLRADLRLHLYISDSPCGDASIYPVPATSESTGTEEISRNGAETASSSKKGDTMMLYTGAKVIVSSATGVDINDCGSQQGILDGTNVAREDTQILGTLRTKSGRSNLPSHLRSTSMSCSDKILQWSILGLQGGLLSKWLASPIHLSSVVVSRDPRLCTLENERLSVVDADWEVQSSALRRAIPDRVAIVWDRVLLPDGKDATDSLDESKAITKSILSSWRKVPSVAVVQRIYSNGKAAMARVESSESRNLESVESSQAGSKRKRSTRTGPDGRGAKISPCGISLNWQLDKDAGLELVVGARGIQQGRKPKSEPDYAPLASRLSRRELWTLCRKCSSVGDSSDCPQNTPTQDADTTASKARTYQESKSLMSSSMWLELKTEILTKEGSPLCGWLRNQETGNFEVSSLENGTD